MFTTIVDNFKEFDFRHKYSLSRTFLLLYGFLRTPNLHLRFTHRGIVMTATFSLDKDKIKVLLLEGVHPNT
ncbi:MAG: hypothetical protein ACRCUF_05600, partial [Aeromonas sobria]